MKIPLTRQIELVFHRGALREPIDAIRRRLGTPVPQRPRTTLEALRPVELRTRPPPRNTGVSDLPPTLQRFDFEPPPSTDIALDVPDVRQGKPNACGDAVVNLMLAHHGLPAAHLATNDRSLLRGLHPAELARHLRTQGLRAYGLAPAVAGTLSATELSGWLRRHGPLIAYTRGHFVVLTGVQGNDVLLQCPLSGRRRAPMVKLNAYLDLSDRRPIIAVRVAEPTNAAAAATALAAQPAPHAGHRLATRVLASVYRASTRSWDAQRDDE